MGDAPLARAPLVAALVFVLTAAGVFTVARPSAAHADGRLPGIDISHWNAPVNWKKLRPRQVAFVIAKATEGQTYDDPEYAGYQAGAAEEGIAFTAYHFARPDLTPGDAVIEADHFLAGADLHAGDLIPALDLEASGGLTPHELKAWTWSWLEEVRARLAVRAMIYTSPSFWREHLNNTEEFAKAGYRLLWIAKWTGHVDVPAHDWHHYGWTFWQFDPCGQVHGIDGCVDRDRYNGTDLSRVQIP